MAEVHIIGQISGATDFAEKELFCMWNFQYGQHWNNVSGEESGQTHIDKPGEDGMHVWAHPIDVHFSTSTCVGWPKLAFQVWFLDDYSRNDFVGYGVMNMPTKSGSFELTCQCWRPTGSFVDNLSESLIGGRQQLKDKSIIWNGEDRRKLNTITVGTIRVKVDVLLRNFKKFGVEVGSAPSIPAGTTNPLLLSLERILVTNT